MTKRSLVVILSLVALMMLSSVVPAFAAGSPKQTAPAVGAKAGSISALLPVAKIYRGLGKNQTSVEAKKGDDVVWNDLVRTEKGGRARITLSDQSILSLGSQAELRIIKHDARSQQTALQLGYGRIRAEVASVTRDGGKFELRTPTAVAGVIGTDFGSDSSVPGSTTFICISGMVQVSNSDPNVPGTVPCPAGETTTVSTGMAPTAPKPATQQQIQQLIQDTEPAVIASLSPASALPGASLVATAAGTHMGGINALKVSGNGVTATLNEGGTETNASMNIVVAADAPAGTRTITFTKPNGQATAVLFNILAPPNQQGTLDLAALKKAYLEIFEQVRQSEIVGINAVGVGVQQSAAQGGQVVLQTNSQLPQPLSLDPFQQQLTGDVKPLIDSMQSTGGQLNNQVAAIQAEFDAGANALAEQLKGKDDELKKALKDLFDKENKKLADAVAALHTQLGTQATGTNDKVNVTVNKWLEDLKVAVVAQQQLTPTPKSDADERSSELGAVATFDGARSTGLNGAAIVSYQWQLCDAGYKPTVVGVPLPASNTACHPISGFAASSTDFKIPTCNLQPQDYIARLTVTDANNKIASVDARLKVLSPSYDDPQSRLRNLASAYQSLQVNQILGFFDDGFSGLNSLQESMRRTFDSLASMNINTRISQSSISCNDATVRADWEQAYTFKGDQSCTGAALGITCNRVVFNQTEQLTMHMNRVPGKGWFITDFVGDSGTVQGVPPGPIQVDVALPDLEVVSITSSLGGLSLPPGTNTLIVAVRNTGNADLRTTTSLHLGFFDLSGKEIVGADGDIPNPLAAGAADKVVVTLSIPDLGPGVGAQLIANANPGCSVPERACDSKNQLSQAINIGTVDLGVSNVRPSGAFIGTQPGTILVDVTNSGSRSSVASAGNLIVRSGTIVIGSANVPSIGSFATQTISVPITLPNVTGSLALTAALSPASAGDLNSANDTAAATVSVSTAVDLQLGNVRASGTLIGSQAGVILVDVTNLGAIASTASTGNLLVRSGTVLIGSANLPSVAAGATQSISVPVIMPNLSGSVSLGAAISPASASDINAANDLATGSVAVTSASVDLVVSNLVLSNVASHWLSGQTQTATIDIQNTGSVPSAATDSVICQVHSGVSVSSFGSLSLASIAAGATSTGVVVSGVVPANVAGADTVTCVVAQDPLELLTNTANNTISGAITLDLNVDLQLVSVPALPSTQQQMGSTGTISFGVKNFGLDTAPAGYDVVFKIGGQQVASTVAASALGGLATQPVTFNFTLPQLAPAPADVTGVASSIQVNANNAVTETNTGNNTVSGTLELVDFAVSTVATGVTAIQGRSMTLGSLYTFLPLTYSGSIAGTISGLPAGVVQSGSSITGTPTSTGISTVTANFSNSGVTHAASGSFTINVGPEVTVTPGVASPLTAGGGSLAYSVTVAGGVYPVSLTLSGLPSGVSNSSAATQALAAPGTVTWNLAAGAAASSGAINAVVTATDSGIPSSNTPAGNVAFALPVVVAGSANYILTGAVPTNHSGNPIGSNAFQVGETVTFDVSIANVGGDTQAGNVVVDIACTPTCGSNPATVAAPAAGQTVTAQLSLPVSVAPGSYTGQIAITSAPAQTSTADDSLTGFTFAVGDFFVGTADESTLQNVPIGGGNATWQVAAFDDPSGSAFALSSSVTSGNLSGVTITPGTLTEGTNNITINAANGTTPASDALTLSATRFGVTKTVTRTVNYYTAGIDFVSTTGDNSSNPVTVGIGGSSVFVTLKLRGTFDTSNNSATLLAPNPVSGINPTSPYTSLVPNDTFYVQLDGLVGATANVVTPVTVSIQVPNTNPVQTVSTTIYVLPVILPDLAITSITATGSNTGRNFAATSTGHPILTGETIDFNVTLKNVGAGASSGNHLLTLTPGGGSTVAFGSYLPPLAPGESVVVPMHAAFVEPLPTNATNVLTAEIVDTDPLGEATTGGNTFDLAAGTADWSLTLSPNAGTSATSPLTVPIAGAISTNVVVSLGGLQGTPAVPIHIYKNSGTSHVSVTGIDGAGSTLNGILGLFTTVNSDLTAPSGEYAYVVSADLNGGIAHRSLTIHIKVGTGIPVTSVTIASDANNLVTVQPPCDVNCSPTPVHLDGPIPYTIGITATGGTSTTDLVLTDGPSMVSNVDLNGVQSSPILNNVPYGVKQNINFAGDDTSGFVSTGLGNVIISSAAVGAAARSYDNPDAVGSQQVKLYFDIGDVDISASAATSCHLLPEAGASTPLTISFLQNGSGITANIVNVVWTLPATVQLASGPTAIPYGGGFTDTVYTFTNNAAAGTPQEPTVALLDITFQSSQNGAQVTKEWPVFLTLNGSACPILLDVRGFGASQAGGASGAIKGTWKRKGAGSSVSLASRRIQNVDGAKLPDLQIAQADVSFSPSVPKAGDTVNVRFRLTNAGNADATHVPVALQVNGQTVLTEYFDVGAGKSTLAGMEWANAQMPAGAAPSVRFQRGSRMGGGLDATETVATRGSAFRAQLVVDPSGTIKQKSTTFKTAALSQFTLGIGVVAGGVDGVGTGGAGFERVMIEAAEGCTGVRLTSGSVATCEAADMDILVEDMGAARFAFTSPAGISDLGVVDVSSLKTAAAQFGNRAMVVSGHSYAVQLSGGKTATFTVNGIHNPAQLNAASQKRFQRRGRSIIGQIAGDTSGVQAGDVSGHTSTPVVFFDITYRVQ